MFIRDYDFSERLSETGLLDDLDFNSSFKIGIECPTGGGKSFYLLDYMKQRGIPFIFATDTLLLGRRLASRHECGFYCAEDRSCYEEEQLITVYQHIPKFMHRDTTLIIDEAHSIVTDYSWKRDAIEQLLTVACGYKRIILLSGTPLYSGDSFYEGLEIRRARLREPLERQLRIVNYAELVGGIVELVKTLKGKDEKKQIVVSLLDKSDKLPVLVSELHKSGVEKIAVINSVSKKPKKKGANKGETQGEITEETDIEINENAEHYHSLLTTGRIDAEVIITTYRQGYDLNGTDYELIIAPGKNRQSYTDIVQMMNRFRDMPQLPAYILLNDEIGTVTEFNLERDYARGVQEYTEEAEKLLERKKMQESNYRKMQLDRLFSRNPYEKYIYPEYHINHHLISHEVYGRINRAMYGNLMMMRAILGEFHINTCKMKNKMTMKAKSENEQQDKQKTRYSQEEIKKATAEFFKYFLHPENVGYDLFTKPEETALHREIRKRYKELGCLELNDEQIRKLLEENIGDTEKMNRISAICAIKYGTDPTMKMYRRLLLQRFQVGEIVPGEEIAERINGMRKEVGLPEQKQRTAVEYFNLLFKTKRGNLPESRKMGYRIIDKF